MPSRPVPRHRHAAGTALLTLAAGVVVTLHGAPPASAAGEVYERPGDGVFAVSGHGWGHGHGMSQYGAQGAAMKGVSADTIMAAYYPGTASTVLKDSPIRVRLNRDEGLDTVVVAASGLVATDAATGTRETLPASARRWRVTPSPTGLRLSSSADMTGSTWTAHPLGGRLDLAGPVRFSGPTTVRVLFPAGVSRGYRGAVTAVRRSGTGLATVNELPLEQYLRGVVPRESSSGFRAAALQAQSIAARTYSAWKRAHATAGYYDICDTTSCQVYDGALSYTGTSVQDLEPTSTDDAIQATAGRIRTYAGAPIFAEFSASNGGWSTDGGSPYLQARRDDWDGVPFTGTNNVHSWTARLTAGDLERRFPSIGTLLRIRVTERDGNGEWGGRVRQVVLEGMDARHAATSVSTTGAAVYGAHSWPAYADGLRSSWWRLAVPASTAIDRKWQLLGGAAGYLGSSTEPEHAVPGGRARAYRGGSIYWSSTTGAVSLPGAIARKYVALGATSSGLGFPVRDVARVAVTSRVSVLQQANIYWSSPTGAHDVRGPILRRYLADGGPAAYGLPTSDERAVTGGRASDLQHAIITWSSATGTTSVVRR